MAFEGLTAGMPTASPSSLFEPARLGAIPTMDDTPAVEQPQRLRRPGGSTMGRLMRRSRTRTAGIRFEWAMRTCGPVLRVVATWTDQQGHPHHTSYSVQCNGLEGALDRAIASRVSCGAPMPDRQDLLQRLQHEFKTAPEAALMPASAVAAVAAFEATPQAA